MSLVLKGLIWGQSMESRPEISIVVPCLNEDRTLGETLKLAREAIQLSGLSGEVVVSDNGSTDRSIAIAQEGGARVVNCAQKGYGSALIEGIRGARGKYIVMGDADATYDFREAVPFVEALKGGADLVMGSRLRGNIAKGAMPFLHRWLGTPVLTFLINLFFGTRISDCNCGMRAFTRKAFDRLNLVSGGMEFASEMIVKGALYGLRIEERPCSLRRDTRGKPPHLKTWRDGWRHLRFIFLFAPNVVFALPGWFLLVAGLIVTALVLPHQFQMGAFRMDYHHCFYSVPMIHIGYQALWFHQFEKYFIRFSGYFGDQTDTIPARPFHLEAWLITGGLMMAAGIGAFTMIFVQWVNSSYGSLNQVRAGIAGMSLLILGMQTIMNAMSISMMTIKLKR
jgi:glycosyltransferase involved in cell wall biosynthesis